MQKVIIPNYLRRIKLSDKRRKKYWLKSEIEKHPLPEKYNNDTYGWKFQKKLGFCLFNIVTDEIVIKNAASHDKPRYQNITGNELYATMHESKRVMVVKALHAHFKEYVNQIDASKLVFPLKVSMEVLRPFGQADWDTDNMWIYHKIFLDTLRHEKIIADDSIVYVRSSGGTTFIPIPENETPTMIFTIESYPEISRPNIFQFVESREGTPGEIAILNHEIYFSVGKKKIIFGAAKDSIRKGMFHCLNNFAVPTFLRKDYDNYKNFIDEFASKYQLNFNINKV